MNERNYGIDFLRLILMFMVCMLHTLGQGGVLSACSSGDINHKIFWFIEILSYCAVDGFAIISGYTAKDKTPNYSRIIQMWFQAFFYSFILTVIFTIIGLNESLSCKEWLKSALPITSGYYWYMTAYFVLFLAMPFLNKFIFSLDDNASKFSFIILVFVFSVMETAFGAFKTISGYSSLWLMVLYCIGALAKRIRLFEKKKTITLVFIWIISLLFTWGAYIFAGTDKLIAYTSPTILLNGLIMVLIFSRLNIKSNCIGKITPLVFGIYLFQLNGVVWKIIKDSLSFIPSLNIFVGLLYIFSFAFILFASGICVEFFRVKISKILKISYLSDKIVGFIQKSTAKMFIFLK